jgi:uncharacterized membrane protein YczE
MSLKFFHIFFISIAFLLAVFCAAWAFSTGAPAAFAYGSAIVAIGLVFYGIWFIQKARKIIV